MKTPKTTFLLTLFAAAALNADAEAGIISQGNFSFFGFGDATLITESQKALIDSEQPLFVKLDIHLPSATSTFGSNDTISLSDKRASVTLSGERIDTFTFARHNGPNGDTVTWPQTSKLVNNTYVLGAPSNPTPEERGSIVYLEGLSTGPTDFSLLLKVNKPNASGISLATLSLYEMGNDTPVGVLGNYSFDFSKKDIVLAQEGMNVRPFISPGVGADIPNTSYTVYQEPIPEPKTALMLGTAALGLLGFRRHRAAKAIGSI